MARRVSSRTVVNRAALEAIQAGYVDAFEDMGQRFVALVEPPDAAPFGEGLIETPDWGIWANGRKVAGTAAKPRGIDKAGVTVAVGADFPARFNVLGTIHQPPNPGWFIGPMNAVIDGAEAFLSPRVKARLAGVR